MASTEKEENKKRIELFENVGLQVDNEHLYT